MSIADDKEIVRRVLAGEKAAFGDLIDRHRSETLAFAARLLNRLDAEDAVQEAFLAAFLGLHKPRDLERFRSWLLGITANLCRYRLRLLREGYSHVTLLAGKHSLEPNSKTSNRHLRSSTRPEKSTRCCAAPFRRSRRNSGRRSLSTTFKA